MSPALSFADVFEFLPFALIISVLPARPPLPRVELDFWKTQKGGSWGRGGRER